MNEQATTVRTLRNIKKALKGRLKTYVKDKDKINEHTEAILKVHGLHKDNFDFVKSMDSFISKNNKLNDISIDDNSNKNERTTSGIVNEVTFPIPKACGYDYLYRQMLVDWGKPEAKRLSGMMYDYTLAISDSNQILKNYCWGFESSKFLFEGREFGQLHSKPPKSLHSYIAGLNETIHQMSNHLAGAIAVPLMLLDVTYIMLEYEKVSLKDLKERKGWFAKLFKKAMRENKAVRKYTENQLQSFVHSVNHLSRGGDQSPFTNISVFDRTKLNTFLSDDNLWWMFDMGDKVYTKEHIIEYILEIQDIFLDFFDKGDPSYDGLPYRFPVTTVQLSKNKINEILDEKFLDNICNRDVFRYNIFISDGLKTSSCCRLQNDVELMALGAQSNSFGASSGIGSHRVVSLDYVKPALIAESYDDFIVIYRDMIVSASKVLRSHKNLINTVVAQGYQPFVDMGWINMDHMFSTIGFIGIREAELIMRERFPEKKDVDIMGEWLTILNNDVKVLSKSYKIIINIEEIPGESMAVRLSKVDRMLFGEQNVPFELYSNQFIPLWEDATIYERMEVDGKYSSLITGGGIVHFNLGEKPTPTQIKELIKYAVKCGCEHFALNSLYCKCANGHASFGEHDNCPVCGAPITERLTRVVGFFVPVESWNKVRREYEFPKRNFTKILSERVDKQDDIC